MSDLQTLVHEISTATTAAFVAAIEHLNSESPGTVYAVLSILDSGVVGVSLFANTVEHLEQVRVGKSIAAEDPYWEVHPAEFNTTVWEPFKGIHNLLRSVHDGFWDGVFEIDEATPGDFLAPIIQQSYTDALTTTKVITELTTPMLLGLGYTDPEEFQLPHIVAASEALNTPEWHQKVQAVFAGDQT